MSSPELPDFERTLQLSQGNLDAAELAECHGVLCGLVCSEPDSTGNDYIQLLSALQLLTEPAPGLVSSMIDAFESARLQLDDEELGFKLWLPEDDQPLEERTIALAQWCTGFLAGLSSSGQTDKLSEEVSEALEDLQQIALASVEGSAGAHVGEGRVDPVPMADGDDLDDEGDLENEEEGAFIEIAEYVRIVTLLVREEFRGPGQSDMIH